MVARGVITRHRRRVRRGWRGEPCRPRAGRARGDDSVHGPRRARSRSPMRGGRRSTITSPATSTTVIGVVDVHQARVDRIVPLPARTRDDDGQVVVTVYTPRAADVAIQAASSAGEPVRVIPGRSAEPARVARWKNGLLDLSLRNRLINFTARSALSVAVPEERLGLLEDLLHRGQPVVLNASDEFAAVDRERGLRHARDLPLPQLAALLEGRRTVYIDVTSAAYQTRLRALAYKARTIVEETGANNLYLALGSLVWELDGRPLRSPLILVPVVLKAAGRGGPLPAACSTRPGRRPRTSVSLEKLRQVHGLDVPGLADPATTTRGSTSTPRSRPPGGPWPSAACRTASRPTADLAVLQFAKFRLWKDLDENWAEFVAEPARRPPDRTPRPTPFADPVAGRRTGRPRRARGALPGSRRRVAAARRSREATAGRTFVLEGPPGTGQVADHHQPAGTRRGRGQAGAVRRREAGRPRRRADAARRRRYGPALARPARQGQQAGRGARADPARPRHRMSSPTSRTTAAQTEDLRSVPPATRPGTQAACTSRTPPGFRCTRARDAELAIGGARGPVLPIPARC